MVVQPDLPYNPVCSQCSVGESDVDGRWWCDGAMV